MTPPPACSTSGATITSSSPNRSANRKSPSVLGAHELEEGKAYFIVPTTQSGLYRYQISDLVRVRGFLGRTPVVEFLGKGHRFANMTGEKISEHQVTQAMTVAMRRTGFGVGTYSLAPIWDDVRPYYGLFVEEADTVDAAGLSRFLRSTIGAWRVEHRVRGQTRGRPPRPGAGGGVAPGAWAEWDRGRLAKTGGSPEQYKHPCLIGDLGLRDSVTVRREVA